MRVVDLCMIREEKLDDFALKLIESSKSNFNEGLSKQESLLKVIFDRIF